MAWSSAAMEKAKALYIPQPEVVSQYLKKRHADLVEKETKVHGGKSSAGDFRSRIAGFLEGSQVDLSKPMTAGDEQKRIDHE